MLSPMRHLLVVPLVLFAVLVALASANAAGPAAIAFSPQSAAATVGATVAVDVTVANVDPDPGLAAYDLTLKFNPVVVRLDSFSDAGFVTTGQNIIICVTGLIDNAVGTVNATCTAIPLFGLPGVPTAGPITLLHASFTALAAGSSPLVLSGSLSGPTGTPIAVSFSDGALLVTAPTPAASATATATPAATRTPAASPTPAAAASAVPATQTATVAAVPSPTSTIAVVKAPAVGSGGSAGRNLTGIVLIGAAIAAVIASLLLFWRSRVKNNA